MAAVLIMRSEATAEASLARRRERRKLGIAIAEMIKMIDTTISSSIREKPFCSRMSSPEASIWDTRLAETQRRQNPPAADMTCSPVWNLISYQIRTAGLVRDPRQIKF